MVQVGVAFLRRGLAGEQGKGGHGRSECGFAHEEPPGCGPLPVGADRRGAYGRADGGSTINHTIWPEIAKGRRACGSRSRWTRATASARGRSGTSWSRRCGGSTSSARQCSAGCRQRASGSNGPCPTSPRRWCCAGRGGALVAMRDGLHFLDPATGRLELFCRPDADRPDNRSNEAKCGPSGDFWLGTMQNNLQPDGSAARDDRQHRRTLPGAAGRQLHPRGRRCRPVQHAGLDRRRPNAAVRRHADRRDLGVRGRDDGRLGARRVFSDEKLPGYCDGSAIDARATCGTPASPAAA